MSQLKTFKFKAFLVFAIILFLLIIGYLYKSITLSFPFVDEQYNFAIGKYLANGDVLYDDIVTNHQPIAHILSALVQQARNPNTTFSLLVSHRTAVIIWSSAWALLLVAYFGTAGFLFVILYELTKSYMFGQLFLAESIVVYPLLFIIGIVFRRKSLNKLTLAFLGISLALVLFTLGPLWPALAFLSFLLIFKLKNYSKQKLLYLAGGISAIILFVGKYTFFSGYIHDYLYLNIVHTVPQYHASYYNESWAITFLKAFIAPVLSFTNSDVTAILWVIRLLSLLLIVNVIFLIRRKEFKRVAVPLILLGLSNIRFVFPGTGSYQGFHLLPWYSVLVFVTVLVSIEQFKQKGSFFMKAFIVTIIIVSFILGLSYSREVFSNKGDSQKEYTVNYSTHTDIGQIIKIMKSPEDSLFISPDTWLVYWQSDTAHIPKLFGYYAWMSGIPEFHKKIIDSFSKAPPTFFYCEDCKGLDLGKFLNQYREIKRNGGSTHLFVLPYRIESQGKMQLEQLKFYGVD